MKVSATTKASPTYLTIPENSNISARMYDRYPIVKTIMGSNTATKMKQKEIKHEKQLMQKEYYSLFSYL